MNTEKLIQEGRLAVDKENYRQADKIFSDLIREQPDNQLAKLNLARLAAVIGRNDAALKIAKNCNFANAELLKISHEVAKTFYTLKDFTAARKFCEMFLSDCPDQPDMLNILGAILRADAQYFEAASIYQKLTEFYPNNTNFLANRALTLINIGNKKEATKLLYEGIKKHPNAILLHYHLSSLKKYTQNDEHMNILKKLYEENKFDEKELRYLYITLAKSYEDTGQIDLAFTFFQKANAITQSLLKFETTTTLRIFDIYTEFKNKILNVNFFQDTKPACTPIFIVGMPRSGTTLIHQILTRHSEAYGAGELHKINNLASGIINEKTLSEEVLKSIRAEYLHYIEQLSGGKRYVIDKMPTNFFYLPMLIRIFPEAKFIHTVRDTNAVCWSLFRTNFEEPAMAYTTSLQSIIEYYGHYKRFVEQVASEHPNKLVEVSYESLTEAPAEEIRRLISCLGLKWESACLNPELSSSPVATASMTQIRRPIYRNSSENWKKYEKYLADIFVNQQTEEQIVSAQTSLDKNHKLQKSPIELRRQIDRLIGAKSYLVALDQLNKSLKQYPLDDELIKIKGICLSLSGDQELALKCLQHAHYLDPNNYDTLSKLGAISHSQGKLKDARGYYQNALKLKPELENESFSLASIYFSMGEETLAEEQHHRTLKMYPENWKSLLGLSNIERRKRNFVEALSFLRRAIAINPENPLLQANLVTLLSVYTPTKFNEQSIEKAEAAALELQRPQFKPNNTKILKKFLEEQFTLLKDHKIAFKTNLNQIYRSSTVELNCKPRIKLFRDHSCISKQCFNCIKLQMDVEYINHFLVLFFELDTLELNSKHTIKYLIEKRENIAGRYKVICYCKSVDDANKLQREIEACLASYLLSNVSFKIKRGCSEFPNLVPNFDKVESNYLKEVKYTPKFAQLEQKYMVNSVNLTRADYAPRGIHVNDILVIMNWLKYAREIGDPSYNEFRTLLHD